MSCLLITMDEMRLPPLCLCKLFTNFYVKEQWARHNFNLHSNQGMIVEIPEYIIGSSRSILTTSTLSNRLIRRPSIQSKPNKSDNLEARFRATLHDKGLKNSDSYVKPSKFTSIFESKRLLHDTPIFKPMIL
jgi:hypothetical protein